MKTSDYIISYLVNSGSKAAFGMSGGAAVHLFDSASKNRDLSLICTAHEQSAAIAADGYARITGKPALAIVTSGPGATNLLTGVCCAYYDSIPMVVLTGQVSTPRLKGSRKVRQVGFQETDVLSIFGSVTKSSHQLSKNNNIKELLYLSYKNSLTGRKGPVLIDLPDDLQRSNIDSNESDFFNINEISKFNNDQRELDNVIKLFKRISISKRPMIIIGGGVSSPNLIKNARSFINNIGLPIVQTWAGLHVIPNNFDINLGTFGVYGSRLGNIAIQNADLIICIGSRLSQNLTGGNLFSFAPNAYIAMIDVDFEEMNKFDGYGIQINLRINLKFEDFYEISNGLIENYKKPQISNWISKLKNLKNLLPNDHQKITKINKGSVDAIDFVKLLSSLMSDNELIYVDTGATLTWTCNNLILKPNQLLFSAWNFTPMGYSLPAAIGGFAANSGRSITCIIGDGGLQLCLGELSTIIRYNIPVKIILFNNHGHGIQKQTLETWLNSHYVGVDESSGLALADFKKVAKALGFPVINIENNNDIITNLRKVYKIKGPVFCNVEISPDQRLYPFLKFGNALDRQSPFLSDEILNKINFDLKEISNED